MKAIRNGQRGKIHNLYCKRCDTGIQRRPNGRLRNSGLTFDYFSANPQVLLFCLTCQAKQYVSAHLIDKLEQPGKPPKGPP